MKIYWTLLVLLLPVRLLAQSWDVSELVTISKQATKTIRPNIIWQEKGSSTDTLDTVKEKYPITLTLVFAKKVNLKINQIQVLINGQAANEHNILRIQQKKSNEFIVIDSVDVPYGVSQIKLAFLDKTQRTESETRVIRRIPPDLYLFTAGVKSELQFTGNDARDMDSLFKAQEGRLFRKVYSAGPFISGEQTKGTALQDSLTLFLGQYRSKIRSQNDLIVLVLSGHGNRFTTKNGEDFGLQGSDYRPDLARTHSLYYQQHILAELEDIKCKKIIFLDACHSGASTILAQKGDYIADLAQAYVAFSQAPAQTITLVSSNKFEFSYEDKNWQNGAFIFSVKRGLSEGLADEDKNGFVTVQELFDYLREVVPNNVKTTLGKNQHPLMEPKEIKDFPIYKWR